MREKQVGTRSDEATLGVLLAATLFVYLHPCTKLHLSAEGRQFSPSRSKGAPVVAPQSLASLEAPAFPSSSTDTSWESWPSSKPSTSAGGGASGLLPLSRCVSMWSLRRRPVQLLLAICEQYLRLSQYELLLLYYITIINIMLLYSVLYTAQCAVVY